LVSFMAPGSEIPIATKEVISKSINAAFNLNHSPNRFKYIHGSSIDKNFSAVK
jgi:hypothetical protein